MIDLILVRTNRFEHRSVQPHFINPCCFGEDFATWLRHELLRAPDVDCSEPIQEDYGWGIWVSRASGRFWVAVSMVGDGPQEGPAQWAISIRAGRQVFRSSDPDALRDLRELTRRLLTSADDITVFPE